MSHITELIQHSPYLKRFAHDSTKLVRLIVGETGIASRHSESTSKPRVLCERHDKLPMTYRVGKYNPIISRSLVGTDSLTQNLFQRWVSFFGSVVEDIFKWFEGFLSQESYVSVKNALVHLKYRFISTFRQQVIQKLAFFEFDINYKLKNINPDKSLNSLFCCFNIRSLM